MLILYYFLKNYFYFMAMDLKKFKENYDTYTFDQKKNTVITMLNWVLWKWDNFDNIYNFIINNPDQVYENELDEVFWILLLWMYQDGQDKLKEAEGRLDQVKNRMMQLKEQERKEKQEDDADKFLDNAFLSF